MLRSRFVETLDRAFATYARWLEPLQAYYRGRHPRAAGDSEAVYRSVIRAKALDSLRGLLPAATRSNVGVYGSGQAYEALLLRMQAQELAESRELAGLMLVELRKVIPAFLERVDREDRGGRWREYLRRRNADSRRLAVALAGEIVAAADADSSADDVVLTEFDPEGEIKVVAAALYPASGLPYEQLLAAARTMTVQERIRVLRTSAGARENRRHRPGRAFEHATYAFDVLSDYGAFRDLQRHRMLTIDWQDLTVRHGCVRPADIDAVGARADWDRAMDGSARSARADGARLLSAGRPVRGLDGLPHALSSADERPRGDARPRGFAQLPKATPPTVASASECTGSSRSGRDTRRSPTR